MPDQARTLVRQRIGWLGLKVLLAPVLLALTGCLAPALMHHDIQAYNKEAVSSEQEMLLFNIGRLHSEQPPHFMMLSSVAQTRSVSAGLSFQWSQLWNSLATPSAAIPGTVKGAGALTTGPFTAGVVENPTIQFVPIQGQDFAQRFESPLTLLFATFLEDRRWSSVPLEKQAIMLLMVQSINLTHGDTTNRGSCISGIHENDGSKEFVDCLKEILKAKNHYALIDGSYPVPTEASDEPKASDLVTALQAGYEWTKHGDKFVLVNPVRIPAWLDYDPNLVAPAESTTPESSTPIFWVEKQPKWQRLQYRLPKGYQWKVYKFNKNRHRSRDVYALVPDGYDLERNDNGDLKSYKKGHYTLFKVKKPVPHLASGTRIKGKSTVTDTDGIFAEDVGGPIGGAGIPDDTTIVAVDSSTKTATMSKEATASEAAKGRSRAGMIVGDVNQFSYAEDVVNAVWPVTRDYFYIELRRNKLDDLHVPLVTDDIAKRTCFSQSDKVDSSNNVVCGYFKIGNLLQIMQRLATAACSSQRRSSAPCGPDVFGIGAKEDIPSWADYSASYTYRTEESNETQWVWVPAHDPAKEPMPAELDRIMFLTLYKLYQMALVDTSKLVTGAPAITISK